MSFVRPNKHLPSTHECNRTPILGICIKNRKTKTYEQTRWIDLYFHNLIGSIVVPMNSPTSINHVLVGESPNGKAKTSSVIGITIVIIIIIITIMISLISF